MNILKWLFGFDGPPPKPPAPVADDTLAATRNAAETAIAALRRKQEEGRRRTEEARRKQEEAERKRREEERKRRGNEAAGISVCEEPPVARRCFDSPVRYSISSTRSFLQDEFETFDSRAFSRRVAQGVKDVYGGNPVPFYTAAGLSRSAYSKIISFPDRHPSKDTVLAMAAALRMPLADAESFLRLAGYALSDSIPSDLVWRACFAGGVHHLPQIRQLLAEFAGR